MSQPDHEIPFDRLPAGFAESVAHPPSVPVTPRPAATIVLLRDGIDALEVLLLRRSRSAGFVPGAYVFPGGRVDGADGDAELSSRVDGLTTKAAGQRLSLQHDEATAMAYYVAALREAFEETGILVGRRADGSPPPTAARSGTVDALRDDVMEDRITFTQALDRMGCRIDGEAVAYVAHWITPEAEPRRYDTRFFAARVAPGAEPIVDPREMTDAIWVTPAEALRRHNEGDLPLVFPTLKTLEQLAPYASTGQALDELGSRPVSAMLPKLVVTPTGVCLELET
jgi:8-oxo-dGTP pyrophosphatase MutT (NUDIX family)